MHCITSFHDHVLVILSSVVGLVGTTMAYLVLKSTNYSCKSYNESELLELGWTIGPCIILTSLVAPSLITLYLTEELVSPQLTIKVIGHQWYWSYEYDGLELEFSSYLKKTDTLESLGMSRLLEVDYPLVLPSHTEVRLIVTSSDVIHAWAMPSMGTKIDAVPGRLNQITLYSSRVGKSFGQCSEICGSLHAFMPIVVEVIPCMDFEGWLLSKIQCK